LSGYGFLPSSEPHCSYELLAQRESCYSHLPSATKRSGHGRGGGGLLRSLSLFNRMRSPKCLTHFITSCSEDHTFSRRKRLLVGLTNEFLLSFFSTLTAGNGLSLLLHKQEPASFTASIFPYTISIEKKDRRNSLVKLLAGVLLLNVWVLGARGDEMSKTFWAPHSIKQGQGPQQPATPASMTRALRGTRKDVSNMTPVELATRMNNEAHLRARIRNAQVNLLSDRLVRNLIQWLLL